MNRSLYADAMKRARAFVDLEQSSLDQAMHDYAKYASGRLVDVGCGDKPYESLFLPYVTEYVGVEYGGTYDTSANATKGKADVLYDGKHLPFPDASFDTVLCNQVGEHVPDPRAFFTEIVRVLKRGGRLLYTVPFSYRIHSEPHDFHRFTKYALEEYADTAGLDVEVLAPRGGFWFVIGQKLASHVAFRYAGLKGELQKLGALGYEQDIPRRPRYWALPVLGPAIVGIAAAARALDRIDHDETDTLGYVLIAKKR